MLEAAGALVTSVIESGGYGGLFLLMVLESMIVPVPSTLVMPFAGHLAQTGRFSVAGAMAATLLGSLAGSLLSYWMAMRWGPRVTEPFLAWRFVSRHHLEATRRFFDRHGALAVFVARFVPVLRHLISLPAGYSRMPLGRFGASTLLGAGIWNGFLFATGYFLGENWPLVKATLQPFELAFAAAFLLFSALLVVKIHARLTRGSPAGQVK